MGMLAIVLLFIGCIFLLAIGVCMVVWAVFHSINNGVHPNDI